MLRSAKCERSACLCEFARVHVLVQRCFGGERSVASLEISEPDLLVHSCCRFTRAVGSLVLLNIRAGILPSRWSSRRFDGSEQPLGMCTVLPIRLVSSRIRFAT